MPSPRCRRLRPTASTGCPWSRRSCATSATSRWANSSSTTARAPAPPPGHAERGDQPVALLAAASGLRPLPGDPANPRSRRLVGHCGAEERRCRTRHGQDRHAGRRRRAQPAAGHPGKALGGYIDTDNGKLQAFFLVMNNSPATSIQDILTVNNDLGKIAARI